MTAGMLRSTSVELWQVPGPSIHCVDGDGVEGPVSSRQYYLVLFFDAAGTTEI